MRPGSVRRDLDGHEALGRRDTPRGSGRGGRSRPRRRSGTGSIRTPPWTKTARCRPEPARAAAPGRVARERIRSNSTSIQDGIPEIRPDVLVAREPRGGGQALAPSRESPRSRGPACSDPGSTRAAAARRGRRGRPTSAWRPSGSVRVLPPRRSSGPSSGSARPDSVKRQEERVEPALGGAARNASRVTGMYLSPAVVPGRLAVLGGPARPQDVSLAARSPARRGAGRRGRW